MRRSPTTSSLRSTCSNTSGTSMPCWLRCERESRREVASFSPSPLTPLSGAPSTWPRNTSTRLTQASGKASFEVEYLSYFMSLLFPAMWLRRHLLKADREDLAVVYDSEFRIVPGINRVAYEILRQESHLIRRGRR